MRTILSDCCKILFLSFLLFCFATKIKAQAPANDNCSGAILLTSATSCNAVTGTFINATNTTVGASWVTTFSSSGTFVCPSNASTAVVECWGGGGAGGGATGSNARGGGGGGGAFSLNNNVSVTSGNSYAIVVGGGGVGGTVNGPTGGFSSFASPTVVANFGNGGAGASTLNSAGAGGTGGAGGTFAGGNGSNAVGSLTSGAGGGGAGSGGIGGNAIGITAGSGGFIQGGIGGAGSNSNNNTFGNNGSTYGGGGSGAIKATIDRNGGNGANGFVRISICGDPNSPDVWYKFVAASSNPTIVLSNIDNNLLAQKPYIQLLSGICGAQTQIATSTTNTLSASGLGLGTIYYIRITTNTNFASSGTGTYTFDICVQDPLPAIVVDYSKAYINVSDLNGGGTINHGNILEIRATLVVKSGTITNISYYDTLKKNAGFIFKDSIATRTNEGKNYKTFTNAVGDDAGWKAPTLTFDTSIQINIGAGATAATGGSLSYSSLPSFYGGTCIIMATYRVTVDTTFTKKINFGGGAFKYKIAGVPYTISFPRDSLFAYETLTACSDAVSPANLIGTASSGTFGNLTNGISASGTQNGGAAAINTTYLYETYSTGPNDYYYGISNNTSKTNAINQTVNKSGNTSRVFGIWDITGDHTGATNTAKGNKPCDASLPVSATNPCGYMLAVNAAYRTDKVFEYTASGVCSETYYEVSAWFKNLCYKCGCDSTGRGSGSVGYIPTAPGDSSGVRPNIAMQIDGIDYYTTGELKYQGLGGTQTGSDTLNNWVRRSFVFKTGPLQTSFKVTFRNNAPGGGGNDWAVDDIGLRTCYPIMIYSPTNPIVFIGNSLIITDTVRSYFNSYTWYKWQRKPVGGVWADVVPISAGNAVPVLINGQYQYVINYIITGVFTQAGNAGDAYRMVVASSALNLASGCSFVPSTTFTLLPTDAPCALTATNYAIAPQTGNIDWNKLSWSLGHVPTCCESAHITYTGSSSSTDSVIVDITNDICIINLTLINNSNRPNQLFRTILHPGFNMQMNGDVRMGAPATAPTDSCIFIAKGGGTITVNGNTVIGYPADLATSIIGSFPGTTTYANYYLKGDSLTFNSTAFTNHKFTAVTLVPTSGAAQFVNNTNAVLYPTAVTFDSLKIGNATPKIVTCAGTNQNAFMNNNDGSLFVSDSSTLIMPANYSINAIAVYNSNFNLRPNAKLFLGGISGGIPGSNFPADFVIYNLDATSTVVFNGAAQTIPGTTKNINTYGHITLTGTGVKTASSSNINLAGNLYRTNGGHTFNANGGRVTFTSAINGQRYYADAGATAINFYDFTNNNTNISRLFIDSTMGVLNELELKANTKITLNTGNIIMRSTAANTSHIYNLGVSIPSIIYNTTYRFIVERYLNGYKSWRFLAAPVQEVGIDVGTPTIAAAWREGVSTLTSTGYGTAITGPTGVGTEMDYYTQRGSIKYYNDASNVWTELTNTTSTKIANKTGYMVFGRGDRGASNPATGTGTPFNLRINGKIRTGDQVFNVLANKFQSIGNPYASQINFGSITKTFVANTFTIWKPSLIGLYGVGGYENYVLNAGDYWLNGIVGGTKRNTLESGEAFFLQNNSASVGTVTIKESDKGILSNLVSRTVNNDIVVPTLDIRLFEKNASDSFVLVDGVSTSFDNSFSSELNNEDAIKFTNTYDNLFIKSNNQNLVVERRPNPAVTDTIKLGITGTRIAAYRFQIDPYLLDNTDLNAFLVDKYLQTETALNLIDSNNINFYINSVAASSLADRFMIVFKQVSPMRFINISAIRNADNTATVKWDTENENNINYYTIEHSIDGINFTSVAQQLPTANNFGNPYYIFLHEGAVTGNNWYRVKSKAISGTIQYTSIAKLEAVVMVKKPSISIYPNPSIKGIVNIYFINKPKGSYQLKITNNLGQVMYVETLQLQSNNLQKTIKLNVATGSYQVTIIDSDNKTRSIPFMVE